MPSTSANLSLYKPDSGQNGVAGQLNSNTDTIDGLFDGATGHTHTGGAGDAPKIPMAGLAATGTPSSTTFLRGDGQWAAGGGGTGVTDHGALTGLADDDHPQYYNQPRGDARYAQLSNNLGDLPSPTAARGNLGAEAALGNPGTDGFVLSSTAAGARSWVSPGSGTVTLASGDIRYVRHDTAAQGLDTTHQANARTNIAAALDPTTTQDDLIVRGASGLDRLGKGTDGQVLTVDPTTHHLVWAAPATGLDTTAGDARYTQRANNLSDVASAGTARTNLGLGTAATQASTAFAAASHDHTGTGDGGALSGAVVDTFLDLTDQGVSPANPSTGNHRLFTKSGGLYLRDTAGAEVGPFGTGGGGATDLDGLTDVVISSATTDQVLKYNGTTWINGTVPGGTTAMVKLSDTVLTGTAASISFSSIPGTYRHLRIEFQGRGDTAATVGDLLMRFNSDTGANYDYESLYYVGSGATGGPTFAAAFAYAGVLASATAPTSVPTQSSITIANYAGTTFHKTSFAQNFTRAGTTSANTYTMLVGSDWRSTAAITSILLYPAAGSFVTGTTVSLYGVS